MLFSSHYLSISPKNGNRNEISYFHWFIRFRKFSNLEVILKFWFFYIFKNIQFEIINWNHIYFTHGIVVENIKSNFSIFISFKIPNPLKILKLVFDLLKISLKLIIKVSFVFISFACFFGAFFLSKIWIKKSAPILDRLWVRSLNQIFVDLP